MSLLAIGNVDELVDTSYSGFAYPSRKSKLALLENDADTDGNVVVQEGSLPYREATVTVVVESSADFEAIRGYEEAGDPILFIDRGGVERTVVPLSFGPSARPGEDAWDVTLTLMETGAFGEGS